MQKLSFLLIIAVLLLSSCEKNSNEEKRDLKLWYTQPATEWTEALPLGNGRLGAMVFGKTGTERIQLNEESVWTGGPVERANPESLKNLDKIRQLLFEGKYAEADRLAQEKIMGTRLEGGTHTYQTLGDLFLQFKSGGNATSYKRELDLRTAVATTTFEMDGVTYYREVFASRPDEVLVIKLSASEKGSLSFKTWMERPGEAETVSVGENQLLMTGFAEYDGRGTHFASVVSLRNNGGEVVSNAESLEVIDADEVEIFISGRTDFWGDDEVEMATADIKKALDTDYKKLKANHIAAYQEQFNRVDLAINTPDTLSLPTDVRLERVKAGAFDSHLTKLYFQFGRYLLISSSQPGGLPANLQGIWDGTLSPPWNADYHININIQMNFLNLLMHFASGGGRRHRKFTDAEGL
jgi:alpha-L-fucosidase 2